MPKEGKKSRKHLWSCLLHGRTDGLHDSWFDLSYKVGAVFYSYFISCLHIQTGGHLGWRRSRI